MRAIAKFSQEGEARRFSFFLKREGIANELDIDGDTFSLWVEDEDQIFRAQKFLEEWREGKLLLPDISKEEAPQEEKSLGEEEFIDSESEKEALTTEEKIFEEEEGPESTFRKPLLFPFFLTGFFFFLCSFLFFLNWFQEVDWQNPSKGVYLLTPIQNACFYDAPKALEPSARYLMEHPVLPQDSIQSFPLDIQKALMEFASPPWKGLDQYIIEKWHSPQKTIPLEMPRFEKIVEGEVWRLISPSFLHVNFLHILFNIIWLWVLGKQIEMRLSKIRYLALVLIVGILSNTAQYLMSGPHFFGYSGVIMGLVGFIWMRQKKAPWEGYPLAKSTLLFVAFFILVLFVFQFFSFGLELVGLPLPSIPIANTAHITGGLVGMFLGRSSFFSRRSM